MKIRLILTLIMVLMLISQGWAQRRKALEEAERRLSLQKTESIQDRAGGTHNKSAFSWFFENRGKLYPRRAAQGWGAEWPIGSGHEYVYRVNPLVGIPGNVVQGRFTTDEEWEAAYGYVVRDSAKIAFSDNPKTWPGGSWLAKDASGKPVIVSNQDSYCVYNDSGNTKGTLGIQVNQIGYAFSQKQVRDMIYWTFLVINKSNRTYDSLYFGMYADLDIGNLSGGVEEWADDKLTFDRNRQLVTFFDSKGYSVEWLTQGGGYAPTGYVGMVMLETPTVNGKQVGITDFHYNDNGLDDDLDIDSVLYGILSSAQSLYSSPQGKPFFHPGANLPDIHFDDPNLIPAAGFDDLAWIGSGPYHRFAPGDTLKFVTAWVAGLTTDDYDSAYVHCRNLYLDNFVISQPPPPPVVTVVPGSNRASILWDNSPEQARDPLTGGSLFQGYRIYKSIDKGLHWDQIDRNTYPAAGADPVPMATYDEVDGIGKDVGLQYSYVDSTITNGFEYWYSVTSYGVTAGGQVVESAKGNTAQEANIGIVVPRWDALGRTPVTSGGLTQTGTGNAKVVFKISPSDVPQAADRTYQISFLPRATIEKGFLQSLIAVSVDTVGPNTNDLLAMVFLSPTRYRLRDLTRGTVLDSSGAYASGQAIRANGLRITLTDTSSSPADRPAEGDSLLFQPGIQIVSSGETVLSLHSFFYDTRYATSTDVVVELSRADTIAANAVTYNDKFSFTTKAATVDQNVIQSGLGRVRVVPNPYMVSSQYEQEYGVLRREPIRQLKFTNLPPVCTIYIFTLDGDKVQTIEHNSSDGVVTWDMRAAGGREIAAGIYLYLVKTDSGERLDRFAVIK
jgi:hypothetical protein